MPTGRGAPFACPGFSLAFYDHLLRLDAEGQWWFEALWTDERDAALRRASGAAAHAPGERASRRRPVEVGTFAPVAPGAAGH